MVLSDDMKTRQGIVEGTASSFGNSWKSSSTCPERDERLESPCSVSVENGTLRRLLAKLSLLAFKNIERLQSASFDFGSYFD